MLNRVVKVECDREFGWRAWTIRINGRFVWDSWSEADARRLAMKLQAAIDEAVSTTSSTTQPR